mgnify:CR=1 FL=1
MKMKRVLAALACGMLLASAPAGAQQQGLRATVTAPIEIVRAAEVAEIPLEVRVGKVFLHAAVNGQARQFIFDTGSPTMLSRQFAETLGLEIVGRNTGRDAHGAEVTMDVAVVDAITLGDVTFRRVPVLVFDFSDLPLGPCFIDGGILGSEIFAGSAWRIDLERNVLAVAGSAAAFNIDENAINARLYDFGYPHAPIVDYQLGAIVDKALFDTGSAANVALFRPVFDAVRDELPSIETGRGSEGESAGGRGAVVDLFRFDVDGLILGDRSLGQVRGTARAVPPTLLGAGLLADYIVTLDYPGERLWLEPRRTPAPRRGEAGYGLGFNGSRAEVVQMFEGSAAAAAGLRLGDHVIEAQGRSLEVSDSNPRCEAALWLAESFDARAEAELVIERGGVRQTLRIPAAP